MLPPKRIRAQTYTQTLKKREGEPHRHENNKRNSDNSREQRNTNILIMFQLCVGDVLLI